MLAQSLEVMLTLNQATSTSEFVMSWLNDDDRHDAVHKESLVHYWTYDNLLGRAEPVLGLTA
jgi:hypothetical protein